LVLSYFAEKDDDCQKEISEILNNILFLTFLFFSFLFFSFFFSFFSFLFFWFSFPSLQLSFSLTLFVLTHRQEEPDAPSSGHPNSVPEQQSHFVGCEGLHHKKDPERKPNGCRCNTSLTAVIFMICLNILDFC
jgi:hypothetical protein